MTHERIPRGPNNTSIPVGRFVLEDDNGGVSLVNAANKNELLAHLSFQEACAVRNWISLWMNRERTRATRALGRAAGARPLSDDLPGSY
jgi:hypothetical protein